MEGVSTAYAGHKVTVCNPNQENKCINSLHSTKPVWRPQGPIFLIINIIPITIYCRPTLTLHPALSTLPYLLHLQQKRHHYHQFAD